MRYWTLRVSSVATLWLLVVQAMLGQGPSGSLEPTVLDDFEAPLKGWKFIGGQEFPGAKGTMLQDTTVAHGGKSSLRLESDFTGGGVYVGIWKELDGKMDFDELRVWMKSVNTSRIGVRIVDSSEQCHQSSVALRRTEDWQEVVLRIKDLVGGEHWGGANDGKWHGAAKGLGLNLGKDAMVSTNPAKATVWMDDLRAMSLPPGVPTLYAATLTPSTCRPGYASRVSFTWDALPMGREYAVSVHFVAPDGRIQFQEDHTPEESTRTWSGRVAYTNTVIVPSSAPDGEYKIMVGLYRSNRGGWEHPKIKTGPGVLGEPNAAEFQVGELKVSSSAPLPVLPPPALDLSNYMVTFNEDFAKGLSVSAHGPGTRWTAHTPYGGDFGDAGFADPEPGFPFSIENGVLVIEARKTGNRWRSGLLCSVDSHGEGFSQKFGYFEMCARLPDGLGTWPAFWLMGVTRLREPGKDARGIEIDVVEEYGVNTNALHTTVHLWGPGNYHWGKGEPFIVPGMTSGFHTYGVSVEEDYTVFYYDGMELRRDKTLAEAKVPLYVMANLALGGGWPIDQTPNPSRMYIKYIRAYSRK